MPHFSRVLCARSGDFCLAELILIGESKAYFAATFTVFAAAYRAIPRYSASAICSRYPSLRSFCSSVGLDTNETSARIPGIAEGFHTFALQWTPKEYIVYIDGVQQAQTTQAVSHIPEFIILSTEITGYGGDQTLMSNNIADVFEVDYVKVYERKPAVTIYGDCDGYGWVSDGLLPGKYTSAQLAALHVNSRTHAIAALAPRKMVPWPFLSVRIVASVASWLRIRVQVLWLDSVRLLT